MGLCLFFLELMNLGPRMEYEAALPGIFRAVLEDIILFIAQRRFLTIVIAPFLLHVISCSFFVLLFCRSKDHEDHLG
jgi:hypothetical protein